MITCRSLPLLLCMCRWRIRRAPPQSKCLVVQIATLPSKFTTSRANEPHPTDDYGMSSRSHPRRATAMVLNGRYCAKWGWNGRNVCLCIMCVLMFCDLTLDYSRRYERSPFLLPVLLVAALKTVVLLFLRLRCFTGPMLPIQM